MSFVRRAEKRGVEMDDLMQIAYLGLHDAITLFDEKRGTEFITFLGSCVKYRIIRELRTYGRTIRIPEHALDSLSKYRKIKNKLHVKLMREPMTHETATAMKMPVEQIIKLEKLSLLDVCFSLDTPVNDDVDATISEMLLDKDAESFVNNIEVSELSRMLWERAGQCLDEQQLEIVRNVFCDGKTCTEIAERTNMKFSELQNCIKASFQKLRRDRSLRQLAEDYGYVARYGHVTLTNFKRTRTSAVEREVLDMEQHFEQKGIHTAAAAQQMPALERLISGIEDPHMRLMMEYRTLKGLSWNRVGRKMGVDGEAARRYYYDVQAGLQPNQLLFGGENDAGEAILR